MLEQGNHDDVKTRSIIYIVLCLVRVIYASIAMCYRNHYHLRCGHIISSGVLHCSDAWFNPATRRWRKCNKKTATVAKASDNLCGDDYCVLSAYAGRWICCTCRYGYRPTEVNRTAICTAGHCGHTLCWTCNPRTEENIRQMYAEDEAETSEEVEEAVEEDTTLDSITFDQEEDEDDIAE